MCDLKWKTTSPKMEDDQNGRRPKWKTTKMEDDQNGRRPKTKTTGKGQENGATLASPDLLPVGSQQSQ